jgi:hypothetical protein
MGELRIWKGAEVLTARGAEALKERTMAERNILKSKIESAKATDPGNE